MKVTITHAEIQYYSITRDVEMTEKEYAHYLKTGKVNDELLNDMSSSIDDTHWDCMQMLSPEVEIIEHRQQHPTNC